MRRAIATLCSLQLLLWTPVNWASEFPISVDPPSSSYSAPGVSPKRIILIPFEEEPITARPPGDGQSTGAPKGTGKGEGIGGVSAHIGIGPDLQGMARLDEQRERNAARDEHLAWLDGIRRQIYDSMSKQPMFLPGPSLSPALFLPPGLDDYDTEDQKDLGASGSALMCKDFEPYSLFLDMFNRQGFKVSTGSTAGQQKLLDLMEQVALAEADHDRDLVTRATGDTVKMSGETLVQSAHDATEIDQALTAAGESLGKLALSAEAPTPDLGKLSGLKKRLDEPPRTRSPQEAVARGALRKLLERLPQLPEEYRPELLKLLGEHAEVILNIAVGLDPITGFSRGLYELYTGHNLVTGEELGPWERGFAGAAVVSIGLVNADVGRGLELLAKAGKALGLNPETIQLFKTLRSIAQESKASAIKVAEGLGDYAKSLVGLPVFEKEKGLQDIANTLAKSVPEFEIEAILSSEELNLGILSSRPNAQRPYLAHSYVIEGILKVEKKFYRFSDAAGNMMEAGVSTPYGKWLVSASEIAIEKLSPSEVQKLFSLPREPKFVSEVIVPAGTKMRRSLTSAVFNGEGGILQYELVDRASSVEVFNTRLFGR